MRRLAFQFVLLAAICMLCTGSWAQVLVHEIPAPSNTATGLCWDGSALWVSDQATGIYKVNPATGAVIRNLTCPVTGSRGLAFADGYLWTISRVSGDLHVYKIDTTSGAVAAQINDPSAGYAGGLGWDGTALWMSVYYPASRILRVNPADGAVLATHNIAAVRPYGVAYDGSSLWISSEDTGVETIYRVDHSNGQTLWSFPLPAHTPQPGRRPRGVAWDGQFLWVLAYDVTSFNVKIFKYDVSNAVNPDIHIHETSHHYGGLVVGHPISWAVSVANVGNVNLTIDLATLASGSAFDLLDPSVFPLSISPAASRVFTIQFDPPAAGNFTDTLRIHSNDPDENPVRITLQGIGWPDEGDVDPHPVAVDFGYVRLAGPLLSSSRSLELDNAGYGTLHITNIELLGDTVFTLDPVPLPAAIDSFGYINLRLWFTPRRPVGYSAIVRIHSDDPDEPVAEVPVSGFGDAIPAVAGQVLWFYESLGTSLSRDINAVHWIGDVNGDGVADALATGGDYLVYCLNGGSTTLADTFWTFYLRQNPNYSGTVMYDRGLSAISDISGDGVEDVIVGTTGVSRSVYALSGATGALLWTFDTHFWGGGGPVYEVAPVADLNFDLIPDIMVAAGDDNSSSGPRRVFTLSGANGQVIWPGTPITTFYTVRSIHDVTGDNIPEVVGGATNGIVAAYNGATGVPVWSNTVASGSPIFALLPMGNANPEATVSEDVVVAGAYTGVYCLDGASGQQIWSVPDNNYVYRLAVGSDITSDGVRESYYGTVNGWVRCLDGSNGRVIWAVIADPFDVENVLCMTPIPDVTGDGVNEIACGTMGGNTVLLDGWDGQRVWSTSGSGPSSEVDAISPMPDIDRSGFWDVLVGHRDGVIEIIAGNNGIPWVDPVEPSLSPATEFELAAAYPNPFNASTMISYMLARQSHLRLDVFDVLGRHIASLADRVQSAGSYTTVWNGTADNGLAVGSGVYFLRMQCETFHQTQKVVLMK
ncbi:choice-of-anchor D domain-containing protein [candidate division KSB1 bacterium]|nr:MAG: choice-of-anchor D domain-containing protein [candidate division KSB1 bacterium]